MKESKLTVVCFLWDGWCGEYGPTYVRKLYNSVKRNLTLPFKFICITDTPLEFYADHGIETKFLSVPDWRWNLKKMFMYNKENFSEGQILAIDLDTVITGDIDNIASYSGRFCVLRDFYETNLCGGGLISFQAGELHDELYRPLIENHNRIEKATQGAERKYYRMQLSKKDHWQDFYGGIINYKINKNKGPHLHVLPEGIKMVCFHGKPRPHEVNDEWVLKHWR